MQIYDIGIGDHYLLVNKKGFCFALKGVQTHFLVPMRLLLNMANAEGGEQEMDEFIAISHGIIFREIEMDKFLGKSLRQVCEEYEYKDIIEFYIELTKEEQDAFRAIFESPGMFGQGPIFAFRTQTE